MDPTSIQTAGVYTTKVTVGVVFLKQVDMMQCWGVTYLQVELVQVGTLGVESMSAFRGTVLIGIIPGR
jgi:hypothetical protein